jgi:hypothetical protein
MSLRLGRTKLIPMAFILIAKRALMPPHALDTIRLNTERGIASGGDAIKQSGLMFSLVPKSDTTKRTNEKYLFSVEQQRYIKPAMLFKMLLQGAILPDPMLVNFAAPTALSMHIMITTIVLSMSCGYVLRVMVSYIE